MSQRPALAGLISFPHRAGRPADIIRPLLVTLERGARLGPYEIVGALGAGGMGEVYRARDRKLDRDVAIKVLSDLFAGIRNACADSSGKLRTLASLNHPNIAQVYGVIDQPAALVMELVEGEDLAERLDARADSARGCFPSRARLPRPWRLPTSAESSTVI